MIPPTALLNTQHRQGDPKKNVRKEGWSTYVNSRRGTNCLQVPNACKLAMSRALGAAFLNHQVEQLEKTVSNNGPASGNWRDRRQAHERTYSPGSPGATATKRGPNPVAQRKKGGETPVDRTTNISPTARKRSGEEERKDADVVVVDASVLVNALYQVKKWCRDGREEIVIVPLEGEYCFLPSPLDNRPF